MATYRAPCAKIKVRLSRVGWRRHQCEPYLWAMLMFHHVLESWLKWIVHSSNERLRGSGPKCQLGCQIKRWLFTLKCRVIWVSCFVELCAALCCVFARHFDDCGMLLFARLVWSSCIFLMFHKLTCKTWRGLAVFSEFTLHTFGLRPILNTQTTKLLLFFSD